MIKPSAVHFVGIPITSSRIKAIIFAWQLVVLAYLDTYLHTRRQIKTSTAQLFFALTTYTVLQENLLIRYGIIKISIG